MESTQVLQPSKKVKGAMADIRTDFIRKVYGNVMAMLVITFGIVSPFVFNPRTTRKFMNANPWIGLACMIFLLAQHCFHICMMLESCTGGSSLLRKYLKMFKTAPWNYVYLFTYASVMGVAVGNITLQYRAQSVCLVFALTAIMCAALTVFAVTTKSDFTGCGAYVFVALIGLMLFGLLAYPLAALVPSTEPFIFRFGGAVGATIFGFIIVYDTQLIFGSVGGGERKAEYTIDMYAFAAFELYLDFINFFLYMLRFMGQRD
jgi:hypothetical protein